MNKILNAAYENEKDQLMKQIYQLRELVAKMNDVSCERYETLYLNCLLYICSQMLLIPLKIGEVI